MLKLPPETLTQKSHSRPVEPSPASVVLAGSVISAELFVNVAPLTKPVPVVPVPTAMYICAPFGEPELVV
jgi:hypothetical protein